MNDRSTDIITRCPQDVIFPATTFVNRLANKTTVSVQDSKNVLLKQTDKKQTIPVQETIKLPELHEEDDED